MKSQQYLMVAAVLVSFATCFPQLRSSRRSSTLAKAPEDPEYVVILARTITIGDFTSTISGFTVGNPGDVGPFTTFSGTATADARVADSTSLPATSTTQVTKPHKTSLSGAPNATNPWNAACPVPSKFIINNFVFVSGKGGDVSFTITYSNDTYTCPLSGTEVFANGYYDMRCDNSSQVKVQTDGSSWISISEQFPCSAVAQAQSGQATLKASSNYTTFGDSLFCDTDDASVQTCLQLDPNIEIPVLNYSIGSPTSR